MQRNVHLLTAREPALAKPCIFDVDVQKGVGWRGSEGRAGDKEDGGEFVKLLRELNFVDQLPDGLL